MAKTLEFTTKSPRQIKQGDTETTFTFICKNDGSVVDLTKATSITAKIGNASGYLRSQSITINSLAALNQGWLNLQPMPDLISGLPAGGYQLEIWVTDQAGTSIYPSDGSTGFTITNNIQSTNGSTITTITFDDFVQAMNKAASTKVTDNKDGTITANNLTYDLSKTGITPIIPYSSGSFNDLPLGTVLAEPPMTDGPDSTHGFTTTTFQSTEWGGRKAQIAITDNANLMYLRTYSGYTEHWMSWTLLADGNFYKPGKMTNAETGSPYDDLNTFPIGQTVTIAETPDKINQIKNLPPISNTTGGLTVRTESSINDTIGGIQIAIDNENVMYHRICWGASGQWEAWRSDNVDEHSNNNNNIILPTLSLFQKVGVVGDSYASGELAFDGKYVDHYEISWLQILARKDGFTGTNFSKGGMSTRTWLTDQKCMPLMQSSDAQDLYILALGINDEALGTSYIGSEADIDNGADTFYGNYGKIIKAIQTKVPQAKLVIATIANSSDIATSLNEAIITIANHFTIPVIVQLDDPLFNSSFYKDTMIGGHPTGPVYASMAEAFDRLIGQSMIDHLDYYKTFKKDD